MSNHDESSSVDGYRSMLKDKLTLAYHLSEVLNSFENGHIDENSLIVKTQTYSKKFDCVSKLHEEIGLTNVQINHLIRKIKSKRGESAVVNISDYFDDETLKKVD